jgi:hypothetical protein
MSNGTAVPVAAQPPTGANWSPLIGDQAMALMARQTKLSAEARDQTTQTAATILAKGQDPHGAPGQRTGLVVGYVQSGKTLSFTTVVALARDNQIPLVIVIAGTSDPLFRQTRDRLAEELRVGDENDIPPSWLHVPNADLNNEDIVRKVLDDWRDPDRDEVPATVLLTVMKQHRRLRNLRDLLARLDLNGIAAIIVDDEADQASLNTHVNRRRESPTYRRILDIRASIPNHTFVQYTATPQAPLLINIIDDLSPEFVEVLSPGDGYVGGLQFFGEDKRFVGVIPPGDVPSRTNAIVGAPRSLVQALAFFAVSVAVGLIEGRSKSNPNRSMLVHPSRTTAEHFQYTVSIAGIIDDWRSLLDGAVTEPDRADVITDFQTAYADLATTAENLPPFDEVLAKLPRALRQTQVREVNRRAGRPTQPIEWQHTYAWVLVGGQAMDRGYTVRELSVTYMPRGTGIGNADTLQQRARFFGYKERYFGHCRIHLETAVLNALEAYVEHEEVMRKELLKIQMSGTSLTEWRRRFVLDPALSPCRTNVIEHDYLRGNYEDDWFQPRKTLISLDATAANQAIVSEFLAGEILVPDTSYLSNQAAQQHQFADDIPLAKLMEGLLVKYRVQGTEDSANLLGLLLQLERRLEKHEDETARVYAMRPNFTSRRTIDVQGRIPTIFQGPTKVGNSYTYPGDRAFHDPNRVSVQVHWFDLAERDGGPLLRQQAPVLAIWVPQRFATNWITQHQPAV